MGGKLRGRREPPFGFYRCTGLYMGHDANAYDTEVGSDTLGDLELGIARPRRERILLSLLQVRNFCFYLCAGFSFTCP